MSRQVSPAAAVVAALLVVVAVSARLAAGASPRVATAELAFVALFAESLPFLLAGAALSAALRGRAGARIFAAAASKPRLAAALAPLAGTALPLCDCGLLPLARRLRDTGGRAAVGAFLAGAPLTNPIVIISTLLAFPGSPGMAVARVASGVAVASAVAALVPPPPVHCGGHPDDDAEQSVGWLHALGAELTGTAPTLVLGALAAATLKAVIPTGTLTSLATQPLVGAIALMTLAFILSICSQADAFVAAALPVGALPRLAFLVLGPVLDLRLATLYRREFGTRWVIRYAVVVIPAALLATTAFATAGLV